MWIEPPFMTSVFNGCTNPSIGAASIQVWKGLMRYTVAHPFCNCLVTHARFSVSTDQPRQPATAYLQVPTTTNDTGNKLQIMLQLGSSTNALLCTPPAMPPSTESNCFIKLCIWCNLHNRSMTPMIRRFIKLCKLVYPWESASDPIYQGNRSMTSGWCIIIGQKTCLLA